MKRSILLFILFLFVYSANAQNKQGQKLLYYDELGFGFGLHTQGWGIYSDYNKIRDARTKTVYEFEIGQIRNPKEHKQTQDFGFNLAGVESPKPYVFGKQNNFYPIDISVGREKEIGRKADKSGVSISVKYLGGISLGILKPYYLDLLYPLDNTDYEIVSTRYSAQTSAMFMDKNSIFGGSGFSYGLGQISVVPGVHAKLGLSFDWAAYDEIVKTIEVGAMFDAYYKKVPIMVEAPNQQFIPDLYISVLFGKRW